MVLEEVGRITASPVLHGAESLCRLLAFLVEQTLEHPGESLKEYHIGTTLFGRNTTFDPRVDASVRVQVGRLRSKLIEYYATEGARDGIFIEIPKGSYTPVFRTRAEQALQESRSAGAPEVFPVLRPARVPEILRTWLPGWRLALWVLLGAVLGGGLAGWRFQSSQPRLAAVLQAFWRPFLAPNQPPLVVFSNAAFIGDSNTGMRYFDPGKDSPERILDHYTGTGEVLSIHALDRLFVGLNVEPAVKRGRLLNWDDARNRSVIFVGAPSENLPLREIPWQEDFGFPPVHAPPDHGHGTITNLHPAPGEPGVVVGVPNAIDYAVVCRMGGTGDIRSLLVLAGLTTVGTQAATEFVCSRAGMEKLAARVSLKGDVRFAALLQVVVKGGVPFETRLVAVHRHPK